jgi:hypothetical protein
MKRSSKIIFSSLTSLLVLVLFSGLAFAQGGEAEAIKTQGRARWHRP